MGVEVVGADIASVDVDTKAEMDNSIVHAKENGKVDESEPNQAIKFGSLEEPAKGETISVSDSNLPKDAVDEWPAIKQIHSFYFVRHRPYDDPKIKTKIEHADKEITNTNQARSRITDELRTHRSKRAELKSQVRALITDSQQYRAVMDEKKKQLGPLQQALGQLRNPNSSSRGGGGLCSSEEELNDLIHSLNYRIQHESIPLSEEKQIMREIKQLEGTRAQVIAHAAQRAKIEDSMGQKDAIQDQVKVMGIDLDGVKKEKLAVSTRITQLDEKVKAVERDIGALQQELDVITQKRDQAFETIRALRTQRDQGNALFYQSRALLTQAKDLAAKKDIKALEELSNAEVEKFISLWSSNKAFRDDYERRILPSLDNRQLSRDGRIRNPDEKPILAPEVPAKSEPLAKANASRPKEDAKPAPQKEDAKPIQKKETSKKDAEVAVENGRIDDKPPTSELVKPQQTPPAQKVVDKEKLKELKREEEIAKAKQAMERKKKLAEKAAAKAAVKAQKEAEKKLKDREKKLKKKAAASAPANEPEEPTEAVEEAVAEPENIAVKEEAQPLAKEKGTRGKEKSIRYKNRPKGGVEPLPKAILRKRKSNNYLLWAAAVAALVLMLMVLAYYMF